jgi:DMSO reductase anchor subunit
MDKLAEYIARVGFHGAIGASVIGAVVFVAVYGFVYRPDHMLTSDAINALLLLTAAIGGAAVMKLKEG